MGYQVIFTSTSKKQLNKIDKKQRQIIERWIANNLVGCEDPRKAPDGRTLYGTAGGWRYRVGAWRLLTTIKDNEITIEIFKIGHRRDVYERL